MTLWIDKVIDAKRTIENAYGDIYDLERALIAKLREHYGERVFISINIPMDGFGTTDISVSTDSKERNPLVEDVRINDCPIYISVDLPSDYSNADRANAIDYIKEFLKEEI